MPPENYWSSSIDSVKFQDKKLMYINLLCFYTLTMNYPKKKLRNTPICNHIKQNEIPRSKSKGFSGSSAGKESTCNAGDLGSIPGLGRSPGEGIGYPFQYSWASLVAQMVKNPPAMRETWVQSLGGKIPWRRAWQPTPWTEEPGMPQSMKFSRPEYWSR